jgi:hypothetical protein
VYRPVRAVTSINTLEVLANYTVYDFEQLLTSVKSYSYRQFGWLDSTSFDLTHSLGIDFYSYWRVYQRGQLNWSEFRERLENSATEQTYALQFHRSAARSTMRGRVPILWAITIQIYCGRKGAGYVSEQFRSHMHPRMESRTAQSTPVPGMDRTPSSAGRERSIILRHEHDHQSYSLKGGLRCLHGRRRFG